MAIHAHPPAPPAIQVLTGAEVWTGEGDARAVPGRAVALAAGRILALGSPAELLKNFPKATVVALPGGTLLPGFIEGHAHVLGIGMERRQVELDGAAQLAEALTRIQAWAAARPEGWIQGRGWDQNLWPSKSFPTAADLDPATGVRPAALRRVDGHALWVNSAALKAAGIDRNSPDPAGGRILRDAQGAPTGVLLDAAMELMDKVLPKASPELIENGLIDGLRELRRRGFTAVADMGIDAPALAAYRRLAAQGRLPIRVFAYLSHDSRLMIQELKKPRPAKLSFFQVQGVKFYLDGALGSRGARLLEPYADAPGTGLWVENPDRVGLDVKITLRAGYQPAIHAIGDAANRMALDIYDRTRPARNGLPPRIEHAQIVAPDDWARFGKLGVVASIQPMHCTGDHAWTPSRLGPDRVNEAYPWRAFLDGGALLAMGSDAPIADPGPFQGIAAAETRRDGAGDPPEGWLPGQRLTRLEALVGYTSGNAKVLARTDLGRLRKGAAADLVWVQAPVLSMAVEDLRKLEPGRLWVNGVEAPVRP
jgi:hypothetical protein